MKLNLSTAYLYFIMASVHVSASLFINQSHLNFCDETLAKHNGQCNDLKTTRTVLIESAC